MKYPSSNEQSGPYIVLIVVIVFAVAFVCALCFSAERPVVNVPDNYNCLVIDLPEEGK